MGSSNLFRRDGVNYIRPFILITLCFALWGFAVNVTNPMVNAFSKIFRISITDATMVQVAFYTGYLVMAIPAAIFIKRYSFKAGVLLGLFVYALGAFLFIPAKMSGLYYPFLSAYFVMTCGLSFLETSCNPYIYAMGNEETAIRRINLAQSFNPLGALLGMFIALTYIQTRLCPLDSAARAKLPQSQFDFIKNYDLGILIRPYVGIIIIIVLVAILLRITKMPKDFDFGVSFDRKTSLKNIFASKRYREGIIAQFFYIGAQIMCWTFILQYGVRVFMKEGMLEKDAEMVTQRYNIYAMILFCCGRFVCTWLLKHIKAEKLLSAIACVAILALMGVIFFRDRNGIYCLLMVSGCMSLMFPTIFGLSMQGLGNDIKFAGAGQIMAVFGGAVLPTIQAAIIDKNDVILGLPAVNFSFFLPVVCFAIIMVYGIRVMKMK
jgi:FHS family L-fucose permease-like MFS transporter